MYKDCIVNEMSGKPLIANDNPKKTNSATNSGITQGSQRQQASTSNCEIVKSSNENNSVPSASANLAAAVQMAASTTGSVVLSQTNNQTVILHTPIAASISPLIPPSSYDSPNKKEKKKTMSTILPWTKGKYL